ncbi:hypothetical protein ILYODFUR_003985 [Ilyodon furcidens]|uniref:Uncharacterized protein n=1 Tax=Ilyodon furcidens TaxID=33524 RepID=A0ABV0UQ68_9TELE
MSARLPSPFSTSAERRECGDKATNTAYMHTQSPHKQPHAQPQKIFNPAFNTSYPKHRESSLLKKHGHETRLCPSPCAGWSCLPAIVTVITAVSQMADRLMSTILGGPQRPL